MNHAKFEGVIVIYLDFNLEDNFVVRSGLGSCVRVGGGSGSKGPMVGLGAAATFRCVGGICGLNLFCRENDGHGHCQGRGPMLDAMMLFLTLDASWQLPLETLTAPPLEKMGNVKFTIQHFFFFFFVKFLNC
ncbi:hypothetical protein ACH5RR_028721 [Cinchona calisaya]|uniref:Uncharacterized protein n=1 Tax=Cinchona calisaya TaxID=153742 RepID=A0ABD2YTJ2_9GENT